jgi:hypothetical protein
MAAIESTTRIDFQELEVLGAALPFDAPAERGAVAGARW